MLGGVELAFINGKRIFIRSEIETTPKQLSWKAIKGITQEGVISEFFRVGDILQCQHARLGPLNWQILDIGSVWTYDGVEHKNALTIGLTKPYGKFMFSAYEAFYRNEGTGLPVGQYSFTLPSGYDEEHGGGKTYNFWLNKGKPLPEDGYLTFWWQEGQDASKVKIRLYGPITNGVENFIDVVPVYEGRGGTPLTETSGWINPNIEACRIGNNRYSTSAIKQLINSTEPAGSVWVPKTDFDRPPDWALTEPGFLNGIEEDFLNAIKPTRIDIHKYPEGQDSIAVDKVRLLGFEEVNGVDRLLDNPDGLTLEYFKGIAPTNEFYDKRVKTYYDGSNAFWWLRSVKPEANSSYIAIVNANGSLNYVQPFNRNGVVPVCVIY